MKMLQIGARGPRWTLRCSSTCSRRIRFIILLTLTLAGIPLRVCARTASASDDAPESAAAAHAGLARAANGLAVGQTVRDEIEALDPTDRERRHGDAVRRPDTGQASSFPITGLSGNARLRPSSPELVPMAVDLDEILLEVWSQTDTVSMVTTSHGGMPDLDDDGRADLVFLETRPMALPPYGLERRLCMFLSTVMPRGVIDLDVAEPDALIRQSATRAAYHRAWAADVNGDGHLDLVVAATGLAGSGAWCEVHRGPFTRGDRRDVDVRAPDSLWTQLRSPHAALTVVGDLDGDGRSDFALTEQDSSSRRYVAHVVVFGTNPLPAIIDASDVTSPYVLRIVIDVPGTGLVPSGLVDFDGDGRDEWIHDDGGFLALRTDGLDSPGLTALSLLPGAYHLAPMPSVGGGQGPRPITAQCGPGEAILIDGAAGVLDGLGRNGAAVVHEPRPRSLWQLDPPPPPDLLLFGPPVTPMMFTDNDPFLLADLDGDGFRDAALMNALAADGTMQTPGNGVVVARSMGAVQPALSILDETSSLEQLPGPDMARFGAGIYAADFDGDGVNDLVVAGVQPTTGKGIVRVLKGKRWTDLPDGAGCAEIVSASPGAPATTAPAAADAAVAAWGRVEDPGRAFDPVMQIEPVRGPAMPGDPVLHVDGEQLAAILDPPAPAGSGAYRGRLARPAGGPIVAEVPGPDGIGAHLLCLEPRHRAPLVLAGFDQVLIIPPGATDCALPVAIAGAAHDLDCDPITSSRWEESGVVVATTLDATLVLGVGMHELTLFVRDAFDVGSDSLVVEIVDATPPVLSASAPLPCLWPPDHRLVDIRLGRDILAVAIDDCDATPAMRIVDAMSSEPEDDLGDGHHAPDVIVVSDDVVRLRRERSGSGRGRTYSIVIEAVDASGNATRATVEFVVPHDRGDRSCAGSRRGFGSTRRARR